MSFKNFNLLNFLEDLRLYFFKKYVYTINHKRIALNYLYFIIWSALSGLALATMIRWELAYPGSHFFKGDSLRYLQVITAHGLTMVFYVVIPLVFGFVANFFIPYHVGSKDVAFPRLNSVGFWFLPAGFLFVSKPVFLRSTFFKYFDKPSFYYNILENNKFIKIHKLNFYKNLKDSKFLNQITWSNRKKINYSNYGDYTFIPLQYINYFDLNKYVNSFWYSSLNLYQIKKKNIYNKMFKLNFSNVRMNIYYTFFC